MIFLFSRKSFSTFSAKMSTWAGKPVVFFACVAIVVVWAAFGPYYNYSDSWSLVINTLTTIVTFLIGFLILGTQNRDSVAIQAKLDELIKAIDKANNNMIGI